PDPEPGPGQVIVRVAACGVCRTDLHVIDGELPDPKLLLVPGHQVVGRLASGDRVGIPWLGWACGECRYCLTGRENLCDRARFTGYDLDGGSAGYASSDVCFAFTIPEYYLGVQGERILHARLLGRRALAMTRHAERLMIYD